MNRDEVASAFAARFGRRCEVVARAPGRVNLIGEHTDYNEGFVLPFAVDRATWAACAARRDALVNLASETLDDVQSWPLDGWRRQDLPHWTSYVAGVAALLKSRGAHLGGFDMLVCGDLPVGGGLASSAALEVAAAKALIMLSGEAIDVAELAALCRAAEHEFAGVPCGVMDPYAVLASRPDHALLLDCRDLSYQHVPLPLTEHAIVVIDTRVRHELADDPYAQRLRECREALAYFQRLDPQVRALRDVSVATVRAHAAQMDPLPLARSLHVTTENQRTLAAADALRRADLPAVGNLLTESHRSLRDDYEVSCAELDRVVDLAASVAGVLGARMTGAGFGGCVIALARRDCLDELAARVEAGYVAPDGRRAAVTVVRPGGGATIEMG